MTSRFAGLLLLGACVPGRPDAFWNRPVDCRDLPTADPGETALTDEEVPSGSVQGVITITDGNGSNAYAPPPDDHWGFIPRTTPEGEAYWCTQITLDCRPEASMSVCFWRDDRTGLLEAGDHALFGGGIDVPEREQGGADEWFDGVLTVTSVEEERISGYLQGRGGGTLRSYVTTETLDLEYTIEAWAFRDLPL